MTSAKIHRNSYDIPKRIRISLEEMKKADELIKFLNSDNPIQ